MSHPMTNEQETAVRLTKAVMIGQLSDETIEDLAVWIIKGLLSYAEGEPLEAALSLTGQQGRDSARTRAKRELRSSWSRLAVNHCGTVKDAAAMITKFKRTKFRNWQKHGIPDNPCFEDSICYSLLSYGIVSERTLRRDTKAGVHDKIIMLKSVQR